MKNVKNIKKALISRSVLSFQGLLGLTFFATVLIISGYGQTQQLPASVFLDQRSPNEAVAWSDPVTGNLLVIDAYGKRNAFFGLNLGTTVDGSVRVTQFKDGTQRVAVNLQTKNALCYGFNANIEPAFGYRSAEVVAGLGPAALGSALTRLVYAPQPTGPVNFDWPLDTQFTTLSCDGVLRAGSGYTDGTPGFAQTTQTGLFNTGVPSGCPSEHDADCFPAEKVQFKPTGN